MKITLKGGTNNINTAAPTTKVEEVIKEAKTIPVKKEVKEEPNSENKIKISLNRSADTKKEVPEKKLVEKKEAKKDTPIKEKKEKIQPIHFTKEQKSHIDTINEAIDSIGKAYAFIEGDEKKEAKYLLIRFIKDLLKKLDLNDDEWKYIIDTLTANLAVTLNCIVHDEDRSVSVTADIINKNNNNPIYAEVATSQVDTSVMATDVEESVTYSTDEYYVDETDSAEYSADDYADYIDAYSGVKYFEANTIDLATIFTNMAHKNAIVISDPNADGLLTTPDKNIIAIDRLNNIDTVEATIVSTSVLNNLTTVPGNEEKEQEIAGEMEAPLENTEVTVNGVPSAK